MELVKGIPITQYCDEHRLALPQRLELFVAVCQAVQHAHQKGVLHGDLRPGHVLVSSVNNKPVPRITDFGVAGATAPKLTERARAGPASFARHPGIPEPGAGPVQRRGWTRAAMCMRWACCCTNC